MMPRIQTSFEFLFEKLNSIKVKIRVAKKLNHNINLTTLISEKKTELLNLSDQVTKISQKIKIKTTWK